VAKERKGSQDEIEEAIRVKAAPGKGEGPQSGRDGQEKGGDGEKGRD